jgi:hypothetical protein
LEVVHLGFEPLSFFFDPPSPCTDQPHFLVVNILGDLSPCRQSEGAAFRRSLLPFRHFQTDQLALEAIQGLLF